MALPDPRRYFIFKFGFCSGLGKGEQMSSGDFALPARQGRHVVDECALYQRGSERDD